MTTVAVLGAGSFSGQDFVDLLLEQTDYQVVGISRSAERGPLMAKYRTNPAVGRFEYHALDCNRDMDAIVSLLDRHQPAMIVNFAAQSEVAPSWRHPEHWFQTNTVALARLVQHLAGTSYLQRYLHISSPEVYGSCAGFVPEDAPLNPSTPYAASKAAADLLLSVYLKQYEFPLVTVRATNVYGARQQLFKIIPRTFISSKRGQKVPLHGGGVARKSYIHIRDVSRGELAILESGQLGTLYHLSPDEDISIRDLVTAIGKRTGKSLEEVADVVAERPGQDKAYTIDSSRARAEFGWRPLITLNAGLDDVARWVEEFWEEIQRQPIDYVHKA